MNDGDVFVRKGRLVDAIGEFEEPNSVIVRDHRDDQNVLRFVARERVSLFGHVIHVGE